MIGQILALAALAVSAGLAADHHTKGQKGDAHEAMATATLKDASGQSVGQVEFFQTKNGVHMQGDLTGLPPGEHGFHIHAVGKCDGPDFKSAGDHFNPSNSPHGSADGKQHHAGDMKNIKVAASGAADVDIVNKSITLDGKGENSVLKAGGTALVVHAKPDDYKSQPSGEAGDRIACGVIVGSSASR